MTLKELTEIIETMDKEKYQDYEIRYYHMTQYGKEIEMPIRAIGISTENEILLSSSCPLCDD